MVKILALNKDEQRTFFFIALFIIIFRLTAFLPIGLVNEDNWFAPWQLSGPTYFWHYIYEGRPVSGIILFILAKISGSNTYHAALVFGPLAVACLALTGVYLGRFWNLKSPQTFALSLLFALSPYISSIMLHVYIIIVFYGYLSAILGLYLFSLKLGKWYNLLSVLLLFIAIGTYQFYLPIIIIIVMFGCLFKMMGLPNDTNVISMIIKSRILEYILLIFIVSVLYIVVAAFTIYIHGLTSRGGMHYAGISYIINGLLNTLKFVLLANEVVFPIFTKFILIFQFFLSLLTIWLGFNLKKASVFTLFYLIITVVSIIFINMFSIAIGSFFYSMRVFVGYAFLWCGIFALTFKFTNNKIILRTTWIILCLTLLAFASGGALMLSEQARLTGWENAKAIGIYTRLQGHPDFKNMQTIAISGLKGHEQKLSTNYALNNRSNFDAINWKDARIFNIMLGTDYKVASPSQQIIANNYCVKAGTWPDEDSVTIISGIGIVCNAKADYGYLEKTLLMGEIIGLVDNPGSYMSISETNIFIHPGEQQPVGFYLHPIESGLKEITMTVKINKDAEFYCGDGGGTVVMNILTDGIQKDYDISHKTGELNLVINTSNVKDMSILFTGGPDGIGCDGTYININKVIMD